MDALVGGGGDNALGQLPLDQWFFDTPPLTRYWIASIVGVGLLVQCHFLTPYQLFYSYRTVFEKGQYWRLLSTFLYFGPLSLQLLFHLFFIQRYSRMLEESAPSAAHFSWLIVCAAGTLLALAPLFNQEFLGSTLNSTLVYVWSRKHPDAMLNFFGILNFRAPWLPFFMIGLSVVLYDHWPVDEFFGIAVGHVWYFFNDIYPQTNNGSRPLDPPQWWIRLLEGFSFRGPQQEVQPPDIGRDIAPEMAPEIR